MATELQDTIGRARVDIISLIHNSPFSSSYIILTLITILTHTHHERHFAFQIVIA